MKVMARAGLSVPKEGKPRQYITDSDVVDVPASAYYMRRINDGDLVRQDAPADATEPPAAVVPAADPAPVMDAGAKKAAKGV
ncbi:DUF2635 domain-containing protein [Burkholderia cepacia]|uniref:DUF2635 domain-containing protein n=1 Tax=Burkholderia cepacia TaxID=292 RepID=UPI00158C15C6|nr:DUF2635 domain-containing protein [Burkholderia cepacia]